MMNNPERDKDDGSLELKTNGDGSENVASMLHEFSTETSLHGLRHVNDCRKYRLRWCVWTVAIIGMIIALMVSIIDLYTEYNKLPFLTRINVEIADRLPFPAVTLCNLNPIDKTKMGDFEKVKSYFLAFTSLHFPPNQPLNWSNPDLKPFTYPMNESWFRSVSPDLSSMLFMCAWEGRRLKPPCSQNFSEHFTDMGICYTFNDANQTRRYGPLYTSHTGSMTGLVLYLYINESTYIYNPEMATGVKILLHHPNDEPDASREGILVSPGFSTRLNLKQISYKFLPPPYKAFRNSHCLDTESASFRNHLKYHHYYSYNACIRECRVDHIINVCGCHSVLEPGKGPICSGKELLNCRVKAVVEFDNDPRLQETCNCISPCTLTHYETQLSSAFYPSILFEKILKNASEFIGQPRKRFMEVRIFFETMLHREISQIPQYTLLNVMGTLGGQMGLYLGASMLTVSELAEFLTMCVVSALQNLLGLTRQIRPRP